MFLFLIAQFLSVNLEVTMSHPKVKSLPEQMFKMFYCLLAALHAPRTSRHLMVLCGTTVSM